jgi:hypothetical protein
MALQQNNSLLRRYQSQGLVAARHYDRDVLARRLLTILRALR